MTLARYEEIWTDPYDGYTICITRYPDSLDTEEGGYLMGCSYHIGKLWTEVPGKGERRKRSRMVHIGPLVKTHAEFPESWIDRGLGPDSYYLLGRRRGGFPLRIGSRPAVEELLAELNSQWREFRRMSDPEYLIEGLRDIRRARRTRDKATLPALSKRFPQAAAYDRKNLLTTVKRHASSAMDSIQAVPKKSSIATRAAVSRVTADARQALDSAIPLVTTGPRKTIVAAVPLANWLLTITQGLLASTLSTDLNALLQDMVKGSATIYDKAMDAEYLATHIGGASHRMFDGGHTVLGAISKVRDASPDDTVIQEAMGFLESMFKDMTTPKGLPLATWDVETFYQVAEYLKVNFGIPKRWFYDINSYDAADLLGGVIGIVAVSLCWRNSDTESFAKLVGGMGVSAAMGTNPLLLIVTVVALANAFHKAHYGGEYAEFVDGHLKGGASAGATLVAASHVAAVGGPAGVALLAGLSAGILAHKATEKVSLARISRFIAERATVAATETKKLAERYVGHAEAATAVGLE
ncbi:MAG: hypothetical protein OXQ89_18670 [Rhodospirillaceae bacterium]|nr:hypothetical protein [Rhodospirillaceae bacterium]